MKTYEQALEDGKDHWEATNVALNSLQECKPHPLIGLINGFLRASTASPAIFSKTTTAELDPATGSAPYSTPVGLPRPRRTRTYRSSRLRPLRLAVGSLAVGTVAYASVYTISTTFPGFTESAFVSAAQLAVPEYRAEPVLAGLNCALRIPVLDNEADLLGFIQPYPEACDVQKPSHRTAPLNETAIKRLSQVYAVREGDYYGDGSVLGFHLTAPYQIARTYVADGVLIGASTPLETVQKNALGQGGGLSRSEKLSSILRLPATAAHVAPSLEERKKIVAENMPCVTGSVGSQLGGVLAGDFCGAIFGRQQLGTPTWGEACVVVSAANVPVRLLSAEHISPEVLDQQIEGWNVTIALSKSCVRELAAEGIITAGEQLDAFDEIDALSPPQPQKVGYYNPDLMLSHNAPGLKLDTIFEQLDVSFGEVQLTIDGSAQRRASRTVTSQLPNMLRNGGSSLCFLGSCTDARQADFAIYVGEIINEQIITRLSYETRHGLLNGPRDENPHRSIGSLGKAIVAPLIAEAGVYEECLRPIYGLQDPIPEGFEGSEACDLHTRDMSEIYAISSNIGIANALKHVPTDTLQGYLGDLRAFHDPAISSASLRRGITVGDSVIMSPASFVTAFAAQMNAGTVLSPTMVQDVAGEAISLEQHIKKPMSYQVSRSWLAAPLTPAGTASHLGAMLNTSGCKFSTAKTGTSDSVVDDAWRDKLIGFYSICGGRTFVTLALLGSPDAETPLGALFTNDLISLAWPGFEAVWKEESKT